MGERASSLGIGSRVVVTGGAGFVGVPVVARFLQLGAEVHVIDNFVRGSRSRLEGLGRGSAPTVHEADIRDRDRLVAIFEAIAPDVVVHLAAHHFIPFCEAHPAEALEVNILGTQRILDVSARVGLQRFVFASTADVYRPAVTPHTETDPVDPVGVYGLSKFLGESLVRHAVCGARGIAHAVVARLFNIFGPGETNPHLIPEIFDQLSQGDVLRLGNMTTRRDYVWVGDVAHALVALSQRDVPDGEVLTVNVGSGVSASAAEIVEILSRLSGRMITVESDAARMRRVDRPNLQAASDLLQTLCPDVIETSLEQGLGRLLVQKPSPIAR